MVCLGFEPGAADWKAETNPLSYGGTPTHLHSVICTNQRTLNIGGSITERLTSCLTGLALTNEVKHLFISQKQTR